MVGDVPRWFERWPPNLRRRLHRYPVSKGECGWPRLDEGRSVLEGVALSGTLPAPLIIFSTFVGYIAGGAVEAVAMTAGIFLPAFAFPLVFHDGLEKITENKELHDFLDGVAAAVVGLIAVTANCSRNIKVRVCTRTLCQAATQRFCLRGTICRRLVRNRRLHSVAARLASPSRSPPA